MDFLKKVTGSVAPKTDATESVAPKTDATATEKLAPSDENQSSLFSSANIVSGAARSAFQHDQPQHDNAEVAGAAADLLGAAQTYGKLDKTSGAGSYVDKAQSYLEKYESSHTAKPPTEAPQESKTDKSATKSTTTEEFAPKPSSECLPTHHSAKPPSGGVHKPSTEETEPTTESAKPCTDDEQKYGGKGVNKEPETEPASEKIPSGVGDYAKIAEGFLKKNGAEEDQGSKTGDSDQSGGLGGISKLAGGFFK